jgi:ABC-2 type transport system ATP-binding protein
MTTISFAIETDALSKVFGDKVAVEDLSLRVERGEVFGFLGPNGAGKTTSVKMMLALISPSGGAGRLLGAPLGDPATRSKIGFLPEHFRFHEWLRAAEFLTLHAELYRMPRTLIRQRAPALLERVGLSDYAGKRLRTFSKGMLQRIGLAQALLNQPELVILDEPTSGLDPLGRKLVRDIIRELSSQGTTIFLNSHLLSEVEATCDRVAFIKHGKVLQTSPLHALMQGRVRLEILAKNLPPETITGLSAWGQEINLEGERLTMILEDEENLPAINRFLVDQKVEIFAFRPQQLSLEDLFLEVIGTDGGL